MAFLIALSTLVVVAAVVVVVGAPLRRARQPGEDGRSGASRAPGLPVGAAAASAGRVQDLEAAREAKYREIRDAEMDFRTGKLSQEDYDAIDTGLRAEALEILDRLEPTEEHAEASAGDRASGPGALEQHERVQEEQHAEEDRPTV